MNLNLLYSCTEYIFPPTTKNLNQFCYHHQTSFLLFDGSVTREDQPFLPIIDVSRSSKSEEPLVPGDLNEHDADPQRYGVHTTQPTSLSH